HLKGLAQRHGHGDRAVALIALQRHADVDADWPEARIIAHAEACRETPVLEIRHRLGRQRAAVEERDDAEIAAELTQADARLDRELSEAAPADRVAVHILGAKPLISVTADRSPTARVKAARRRNAERRGTED